MIFYFTGTGNSLYAARSLDSNAISIPQVLRTEKREFYGDSIGIVCPIYGHEMPMMVKEFIRSSVFDTDYLYVILTYGKRHANAAELAEEVFRSAGRPADYIHTLLMVDNFLPVFDMSEEKKLDKHVEEQLDAIRKDIASKKKEIELVTEMDRNAHAGYVQSVSGRPETIWADFRFTDRCIGCGICTKVCPAGCIHLVNHRAVRTGKNCQACMACIHACPEMAIEMNPVLGHIE
ncbi:MAG: EFR1 family ferrodoxin, partial [Bulleidia sp.]